jgi:cytochrome c biogenesis protein CcmG/thiol:disulfide interchange protein DsbE
MMTTMKLLAGFLLLTTSEPGTIRATLESVAQRVPAPDFALTDASGLTAKLGEYRGKVVLLDFWATWCGGCKHEIPWFEEFNKTYSSKGLAVVGVSLDDDGWKVLKPFLVQHPISYRVVIGTEAMSKSYKIEGMPDTFLIDQHGRIAAAYRAGVVDKDDMESNIRLLLQSPE